MKRDIAEKWVAALRSGEYRQGVGLLQAPNTKEFCCLGVLCELAIKDGVPVRREAADDSVKYVCDPIEDPFDSLSKHLCYSATRLVREVVVWAGMNSSHGGNLPEDSYPDPRYDESDEMYLLDLVMLNDQGYSFKDIANVIEEHYEAL